MANLVIPDGGNIGSASDPDAIAISSSGAVTLSSDFVPATPLSHRNMIINGAMQVAQRGTSSTGVTSGGYHNAPDRFTTGITNIGAYTISQSTDAPDGFAKSYKIDCTTADASPDSSDNFTFETRFEGQDLQNWKKGTSSALQVTLSFWVKSNKTGNGQVNLRDLDNLRQCGNTYTISSANTWEYKTITFPADTTGAFDDDNNNSLRIEWWIDSGSNFKSGTIPTAWVNNSDNQHRNVGGTLNLADSTSNNWYITGVQLELGSVATPFEHRSHAEELRKCQRYYYKPETGSNAYLGPGHMYDSGTIHLLINHPVTMRTASTSVEADYGSQHFYLLETSSTNSYIATNWSFTLNGKNNSLIQAGSVSPMTLARPVNVKISEATAYIAISAEL